MRIVAGLHEGLAGTVREVVGNPTGRWHTVLQIECGGEWVAVSSSDCIPV